MTALAVAAPPGSTVDTDVKLSADLIARIRAAGYSGVARYVPLPNNGAGSDIDATELAAYQPRSHIFLDLEGIAGTGPETRSFAEAWAAVIAAGGYSAGCYVGYEVPLSPQELYDLHTINSYWSDAGPRAVAVRGFAIKQHAQIIIAGVPFDPDTIQLDARGDTPIWTIAASNNIA